METHQEVFSWVLGLLADRGLLQGKRIAIDATTLEANAAMRSSEEISMCVPNDFVLRLMHPLVISSLCLVRCRERLKEQQWGGSLNSYPLCQPSVTPSLSP